MRHLTTLPDQDTASRLADYLLTLRIETRLERQPDGWELWVCDEDRVAEARTEVEEFTRNPDDPRYQTAITSAEKIRKQEARQEEDYRRRVRRLQDGMFQFDRPCPFTTFLLAASIAITLLTGFGARDSELAQALYIAPFEFDGHWIRWNGLLQIERGEVWRLVTPIFLHLSILHLLFNMSMLYSIGTLIERRRGTVRYLLMVLVTAVASNLAQYYLGHSSFEAGHFQPDGAPNFGGMSGVLYGLFGYLWMKARFQPEQGLIITQRSVFIMMGWFVLCWTGLMGPIANVAHTVGLLAGMALSLAGLLLERRGK
jgi:GlpG protein